MCGKHWIGSGVLKQSRGHPRTWVEKESSGMTMAMEWFNVKRGSRGKPPGNFLRRRPCTTNPKITKLSTFSLLLVPVPSKISKRGVLIDTKQKLKLKLKMRTAS